MGGPRASSPRGKFVFMMFSRAICLNFCQHLTTRRAMNVNEISLISKTKLPTQGDTSAAAVAIAITLICCCKLQ